MPESNVPDKSPAKATEMPAPQPVDSEVRRFIRERLDDTLFVEASAGTGKTTSLVERMVNLVATGRANLNRMAAITFTEAAAAELRDRVRQSLEEAAEDPSLPAPEREACRQGVSDLDQATITTLHSFAAQLLHERPLEAGLPPGFDTSDEIVAGLRFAEEWEAWLDAATSGNSPLDRHLSLALALNVSLEQLRQLALGFHRNYADLENASFATGDPPAARDVRALLEGWTEIERLSQYSNDGAGDPLFDHVTGLRDPIAALAAERPGSFDYYRRLNRLPSLSTNRGSQKNWAKDPVTGANACTRLKADLGELGESVTEELAEAKSWAVSQVLDSLRDFVLDYARRRKTEGRAEFHDLLVWARDLLRSRLDVRDYFRDKFTHLLIDESQDTDPIQAEIAMFLAEAVPDGLPPGERPVRWQDTTPATGKLFVVGDPKQSIYRFRRADVEQMVALQGQMESAGGHTVKLVQNFRSRQPIIDWVNLLFDSWMEESGGGDSTLQTPYDQMAPWWTAGDGETGRTEGNEETVENFRPRVWALANVEDDAPIGEVREQEAQDIAALLRQIVTQEWLKLDPEPAGTEGESAFKPATYSDICILVRNRTGLPTLERALETTDIPYRLESASLVFETQEIRDLLNCLKAIDDPANYVATVAALRSPAFGCSDLDLLRFYEAGGRFDYLAASSGSGDGSGEGTDDAPDQNPVPGALAALRRFHHARLWETPGSLVDRFIRDRQLLEDATGHPRMREQWRRYRFMVERAWQFAATGESSLRAFIEWIDDQIGQRAQVTESPVPESDEEAVRIMTMHSAKGLEFPVVILTGINSGSRHTSDSVLFDRQAGSVEVALGPRATRFQTPGYAALEERERRMAAAEEVRLMYVAATRARDHLVLSLRRPARARGGEPPAAAMARHLANHPEAWSPVHLEDSPAPSPLEAGPGPGQPDAGFLSRHTVEAWEAWEKDRSRLLAELARPSFVSATALGYADNQQEDKEEQDTITVTEPWRRGRAGTSVGRAVHAVLQSIDLATGQGLEDRARSQATAEGISGREPEVVSLVTTALNSDVVQRAIVSGRWWREVPVAAPLEEGFLHGFIDLLFDEGDGLVVVDYKTDSARADESPQALDRYRLQGGAYALAVSQVTGKPVKQVIFLYLKHEQEAPLEDLPRAMEEARTRALSVLQKSP